jgi:hypothetical protein
LMCPSTPLSLPQRASYGNEILQSWGKGGKTHNRFFVSPLVPLAGKNPNPSRPAAAWQSGGGGSHPPRSSDDGESAPSSAITIALGDLVKKSKPIAVSGAPQACEPEKRGPAWGNPPAGASPTGQTRLQDIQVPVSLS